MWYRLRALLATATPAVMSSRGPGTQPTDLVEQFLAREFEAARRGRAVTLVMFGFSDFETFAEREGDAAAAGAVHEFGQLLQRLTRRMNLTARYRWRADTFLSVLSDADAAAAQGFVHNVRKAAAAAGVRLPAVEAGIVAFHPDMDSPEAFVERARQALEAARTAARHRPPVRPAPRPARAGAMRPQERLIAS
ncbi:MAG TPA: diguanylate cyclase [Longimicrobiales bacterium]|nr:diguanylate cyclase [Longimicrobiales bacterium]